jgi:murein L,D-transpeptidase YafK
MKRLVPLLVIGLIILSAGVFAVRDYLDRGGMPVREAQASLPQRLAAQGFAAGQHVFIRIFKEESTLELWMNKGQQWSLFQSYPICRWSGRLGPKLKEGDKQAPEGFYSVGLGQLNPNSRWHLAFNLGFPNAFDRAHGRTGSYLMVHGGCTSIGCYAMTNGAVDDIYRLVEAALRGGQSSVEVHAFPFRLTPENLKRHASSPWSLFWQGLRKGYDAFERKRDVPRVKVVAGAYVVEG